MDVNNQMKDEFIFQHFVIRQDHCAMKVGTDGVLLGSWALPSEADSGKGASFPLRILDIGTGTGLIALMLAQRFPAAEADALEIDPEACSQAAGNVRHSPFSRRVRIISESLQHFSLSPCPHPYDLIVCNPPFFVQGHSLKCPDDRRNEARHTSTLSYRALFQGVRHLLAPGGVFSAVIPFTASEDFLAEGYFSGLVMTRRCAVKTVEGKVPKRSLLAFSDRRTSPPEDTVEVMMTSEGHPTEWWSRLTQDFYLKK